MNKVKITVQQENVLKEFNDIWKDKTVNERYEIFLQARKMIFESDALKPLTEIDSKDFFFMLHGWYEVETPKFKVGDWVFGSIDEYENKDYYKVTPKVELDDRKLCLSYAINHQECFEKVTEEWKIVLLELGREKPELKVGDKFTTIQDIPISITTRNVGIGFDGTKIKYFYPIESRIEIKQ